MRPFTCIALLAVGLLASGCGPKSSQNKSASSRSGNSPYAGAWLNVADARDALFIREEGDAFVVEDETRKKFVGTYSDGVLRVSMPGGSVDILHVKASDQLLAAGQEYKRISDEDAAEFKTQVNAEAARRESMERMRKIAMAWEARATDINSYAVVGIEDGTVATSLLSAALAPTYIRDFPSTDGWGNPFHFRVTGNGHTYTIRSEGDGRGAAIDFSNGAFKTDADQVTR